MAALTAAPFWYPWDHVIIINVGPEEEFSSHTEVNYTRIMARQNLQPSHIAFFNCYTQVMKSELSISQLFPSS